MRGLPLSYLTVMALAGIIHLDWHLARPHHMRLSLAWSQHWLIAIPVFAAAAGYLAKRFPDRVWVAAGVNLLGAALLGQVLEPLAENLSDGRFTLAMSTERWAAFARLMAAGLTTYLITLVWLERRGARRGGSA